MLAHIGERRGQCNSLRIVADGEMQVWCEAASDVTALGDALPLLDVLAHAHEAAVFAQVQIPAGRAVAVRDSDAVVRRLQTVGVMADEDRHHNPAARRAHVRPFWLQEVERELLSSAVADDAAIALDA